MITLALAFPVIGLAYGISGSSALGNFFAPQNTAQPDAPKLTEALARLREMLERTRNQNQDQGQNAAQGGGNGAAGGNLAAGGNNQGGEEATDEEGDDEASTTEATTTGETTDNSNQLANASQTGLGRIFAPITNFFHWIFSWIF